MTYIGSLPPISNRAGWFEEFVVRDDDSDDLIDLTTATEITLALRDFVSGTAELTATLTGDTIEILEDGIFIPTWTVDDLRGLDAKTYEIGCTAVVDGQTVQILIGTIAVRDGVVE